MKIQLRPVDAIKPYEKNPRKNDHAVDAVGKSIRQFGFKQPIVVDGDGVIVVGHTRWKAALKLGLEKVPVHVASELTEAQCKSYRLADNRLNELATWDFSLLPGELTELQAMDADLAALGFTEDELSKLLDPAARDGLCDPDEIPAPPDEAVTKPGNLILLGNHRLLCGDSSSAADVDRLLDGQPIHLVNTDPPYNVKLEPRSRNAVAAGLTTFAGALAPDEADKSLGIRQKKKLGHHQGFDEARHGRRKPTHSKMRAKDRPLQNDFISDEAFDQLLEAWFGNIARVLLPGRAFYIWGGWSNIDNYPPVLKRCGLFWHQQIIWVKNAPVLCRKDYMLGHEWCFYGWREGGAHQFLGPNNARDVWEVSKVPQQQMIHLTEKPVELARRAIQYSSRTGENVLDMFGGSGSTLIGAEQTQRRAFLMEIDPLYCDVIVQRCEKFTGKKADCISCRRDAPDKAEALVEES